MLMIDGSQSKFLRNAASRLRQLARNAPEIVDELRRFADDLEEMAYELSSEAGGGLARC